MWEEGNESGEGVLGSWRENQRGVPADSGHGVTTAGCLRRTGLSSSASQGLRTSPLLPLVEIYSDSRRTSLFHRVSNSVPLWACWSITIILETPVNNSVWFWDKQLPERCTGQDTPLTQAPEKSNSGGTCCSSSPPSSGAPILWLPQTRSQPPPGGCGSSETSFGICLHWFKAQLHYPP